MTIAAFSRAWWQAFLAWQNRRQSLRDLLAAWPLAGRIDEAPCRAAWLALTPLERMAAAANAQRFLAEGKRARRIVAFPLHVYLSERRWTLLSAESRR